MPVYRFKVNATIGQAVGISAESKTKAEEILKDILEKGRSSECSVDINTIKAELRDKGKISNVEQVDGILYQPNSGWDVDAYLEVKKQWANSNPEKYEDGRWDDEIFIKQNKPLVLFDLQFFIEWPDENTLILSTGESISLKMQGGGYAEAMGITREEKNHLIEALKESYNLEYALFDIEKVINKDKMGLRHHWAAWKLTKKETNNG